MLDWAAELVRRARASGSFALGIVFASLALDNALLTAVVPILPDFLYTLDQGGTLDAPNASAEYLVNENARVGVLFSSKALVQLGINPFVGLLINRVGFTIPLVLGSAVLFVVSVLFATSRSYEIFFLARGMQGIGSACFSVGGMAMLAAVHPDDRERSQVMGVAMGGIALGVLVGYPFGGLLYDFIGKEAPFTAIAVLLLFDGVLQMVILRPRATPESFLVGTSMYKLIQDPYILIVMGAVCVSTTAMAVLEPCLPIWLMETIHPKKWQLGTVFVPDSLGYLLGTNMGIVAYKLGRWVTALASLMLVGVCALIVPFATSMEHLILPHFGLGLGIGMTDAALMPMLALLVDTRHVAVYGSVYALAQGAVSLAYALGPLVGSEIVRNVGFPLVLRTVGLINLLYCPLCLLLRNPPPASQETQGILLDQSPPPGYNSDAAGGYRRFSCPDGESD